MIPGPFYIIPDNSQTLSCMFSWRKTRFCKRTFSRSWTRVSPSRRNITLKNLSKLPSQLQVNIQHMKIKPNSPTNVPDKNHSHSPKISGTIELNSSPTPVSISPGFREQPWALALPRTHIGKKFLQNIHTIIRPISPPRHPPETFTCQPRGISPTFMMS